MCIQVSGRPRVKPHTFVLSAFDQPFRTLAASFPLAYVIRSAWLTAFQGFFLGKTVLLFNKPKGTAGVL